MSRPAPPGAPVSTGRLRVDAARAVDKLREYQLPEPAMWVLEVIRAAVLAEATEIRVHGDADDVIVAWDGPPIEDLERLFDELVDPAPAPHRRRLRLLATGVNTALGLSPRWVDVVALDGSGEALAARFTPSLFERDADGAAPGLRAIRLEQRPPPALAPARGMVVHLKRRPFFDALPILLGVGEPAELALVRQACDDIAVPLTVGRTSIGRDRSHVDLLRVALGEGLDGFVAVTDPSFAREVGLEVAELGVRLALYGIALAPQTWAVPVPLRVFVDAPRMPTNASRSAVRHEEPPVRDAVERARALLPALMERLAGALTEGEARFHTPVRRERLRAAALALLGAAVGGESWRHEMRRLGSREDAWDALAPLAWLPILRDAVGRPRAPASFSVRTGADVVHYGPEPLPRELTPWFGEVLWVPPGDPAAALLGVSRPAPAKKRLARAKSYRVARERWLKTEAGAPAVPPAPGQLLAVPLTAPGRSLKSCAPLDVFEAVRGLEGELVLGDPRASRGGRVRLRIGGRVIETLTLDVSFPFEADVQCAELTPNPEHSGAARDEVFEALLGAVCAAAVVASEGLALRLLGESKPGDRAVPRAAWIESPGEHDRASVTSLLRGATVLALELAAGAARDEEGFRRAAEILLASKSPLFEAPVWPTVRGAWRSLREILQDAARPPHAIAFTRLRGTGTAPSGRPIHVVREREQPAFRALLSRAHLIDYERVLVRPPLPRDASALAATLCVPGGAALGVEREGRSLAIGWTAGPSTFELRHCGVTLDKSALEGAPGPVRLLVEDDWVVPDARWAGVREASEGYPVDELCAELARAFADALIGEAPPGLSLGARHAMNAELARTAWLASLTRAPEPAAALFGDTRLAALREVRWLSLLGVKELVSLAELEARFPEGAIPWVPRSTATLLDSSAAGTRSSRARTRSARWPGCSTASWCAPPTS